MNNEISWKFIWICSFSLCLQHPGQAQFTVIPSKAFISSYIYHCQTDWAAIFYSDWGTFQGASKILPRGVTEGKSHNNTESRKGEISNIRGALHEPIHWWWSDIKEYLSSHWHLNLKAWSGVTMSLTSTQKLIFTLCICSISHYTILQIWQCTTMGQKIFTLPS